MDITISSDNQNYIKRLIETGNYNKVDEILNEAVLLHELFQKQSFKDLYKIKKGIESEDSIDLLLSKPNSRYSKK